MMALLWLKHQKKELNSMSKMVLSRILNTRLFGSQMLTRNVMFTFMKHICGGEIMCACVGAAGHLCPALTKAILTMKSGEKAKLIVQPQCKSLRLCCQLAILEF